jgi:hypothetical protein
MHSTASPERMRGSVLGMDSKDHRLRPGMPVFLLNITSPMLLRITISGQPTANIFPLNIITVATPDITLIMQRLFQRLIGVLK